MGVHVADLVWAVTGVGANRKERNQSIYDKIKNYPMAAVLKTADRIADLRGEFGYDLKTPPEIAAMQDVASVLKGDIDTLAKEAASRFTDLLKRVADLEARLARYEAKP